MTSRYTWMWLFRSGLALAIYAAAAPFKIGRDLLIRLGRFVDPDPPEGAYDDNDSL